MMTDQKQYTEEEVRDFYESWDQHDDRGGCYSIDIEKWHSMLVQHPNLCCELETIRRLNRHENNKALKK